MKPKRALALESERGAEWELGGRLDGGAAGAGVIRGSPYNHPPSRQASTQCGGKPDWAEGDCAEDCGVGQSCF